MSPMSYPLHHSDIHTYTYIHTHARTHTHAHTHTHTHAHTHIHIHMYIHIMYYTVRIFIMFFDSTAPPPFGGPDSTPSIHVHMNGNNPDSPEKYEGNPNI